MKTTAALATALLLSLPLLPAAAVEGDTTLTDTAPLLPPEEQHIRAGIVLLGSLYNVLAQVNDPQSAQAAVPTIVRLTREIQTWAQAVTALPPLDAEKRTLYEVRYLPTIQRINDYLRVQGERLAASDYFGSQDLSTALISLYWTTQQ